MAQLYVVRHVGRSDGLPARYHTSGEIRPDSCAAAPEERLIHAERARRLEPFVVPIVQEEYTGRAADDGADPRRERVQNLLQVQGRASRARQLVEGLHLPLGFRDLIGGGMG